MEEISNAKKKILIFTPYYHPEPFPINLFVEELSNRNEIDNVTVVTCIPNYRNYKFYKGYNFFGPYRERLKKINVIRLPIIPRLSNSKKSIFLFYSSFCIVSSIYLFFFSLFNRNKYSHLLTFCGSPVYVGYIGYVASKILNSQSSLWIQDIWPEAIETTVGLKNKHLRSLILKLQNAMWNFCDIVFSESQALSKYLKEINLQKKIVTLYNPIRTEVSEKNINNLKKSGKNIFSYIGNIGGAQNIELLVDSFNSANLKNSVLHICGDGSLLKILSSKYKNKNIVWHGWIEGKELEKIYQSSDFFILSLNSVGRQSLILPSKLQSYFMNKKPTLCISSGASKKLIEDIHAGITCTEISKKAIIEMLKKAENLDNKEHSLMSQNAFNYYKSHFTKVKIVDTFLKSI